MPRSSDLYVDTSGWVLLLYPGDPLHASASAMTQTAVITQKRRLVTTNYVLAELVPLLDRYRFSRQRVISAIREIQANPNTEILHVDEVTDAEAWRLLEARLDKAWSLVDAASFVVMRRYGITEALTTDHQGWVRMRAASEVARGAAIRDWRRSPASCRHQ